jgi:hypothetical protein
VPHAQPCAQDWVQDHELPRAAAETLVPTATYAVSPPVPELEAKGISFCDIHVMQAVFVTTVEMIESLDVYRKTLNAAGFKQDHIALDIDGKHKLARNSCVLISYGGR